MTTNNSRHLIRRGASVTDALLKLNELGADAILFLVDEEQHLLGSLTDGDLRRGFIRGLSFSAALTDFIQPNPVYVLEGAIRSEEMDAFRQKMLKVIPVLNEEHVIVQILNLRTTQFVLPVEAIIMAGGRGQRLMPLTANTPKPMLPVGAKPILEHNIERLKKFGIKRIHISVNYLADVIRDYFQDGAKWELDIGYVQETQPLGTIGSAKLVEGIDQDTVLVMNSDLLTDIDFADFYDCFKSAQADMAVAATEYDVDIPYAILELGEGSRVSSLKEKPRYTYYSNAGIYLIKRELLNLIPEDRAFDVTDLMDLVIADPSKNLVAFPLIGYWLDIGKHDDYKKAQEMIKHIRQ
ncbi:MAG: nucleotidyltransferase family protein [Bacteroidetes bacterium]|nr:nucleotidyltransferase family protein [Bacteroidota bacterium]